MKDGYIRPVPGSALRSFDPWRAADDGRGSPLAELLALLQYFDEPAAGDGEAEPAPWWVVRCDGYAGRALRHLEEWCSRWGLLGLLLHRTSLIEHAPEDLNVEDEGSARRHYAVQKGFRRIGDTWRPVSRDVRYTTYVIDAEIGVVDDGDRPVPCANVSPLDVVEPTFQPLYSTHSVWPRYFPSRKEELLKLCWQFDDTDVGDEVDLSEVEEPISPLSWPEPASPEFWEMYAEPVSDFISAARVLRDAIRDAGVWQDDAERDGDGGEAGAPSEEVEALREQAQSGSDRLFALSADVSIRLDPLYRGAWSQRWSSPSLLASLAMMAVQGLTRGDRIYVCEACQSPYLAHHRLEQYCSSTCQIRTVRRRQRERQRARKED